MLTAPNEALRRLLVRGDHRIASGRLSTTTAPIVLRCCSRVISALLLIARSTHVGATTVSPSRALGCGRVERALAVLSRCVNVIEVDSDSAQQPHLFAGFASLTSGLPAAQ